MDFLDPRKRRSHTIRLIIGYVLVAIAVCLGAVILVYGAYGYSFNTKTGQIVQNGLLFVDSKPGGANIYLNGKSLNSTTSARLLLPAGNYDVALKRDGYYTWERQFSLDEQSLARFIYPLLLPVKPKVTPLQTYPATPSLVTESPDQHWLLVQSSAAGADTLSFDEYDTGDFSAVKAVVTLPVDLLAAPGGSYKVVEWASDNNHLLLQHSYQGGSEFLILDRANPDNSINIDTLFKLAPDQVALRNKKISQLYIYEQAKSTIRVGDTGKGTLAAPILRHVLAFKSYGSNLMSYVTDNGLAPGVVQARIWDNGKTYRLYTFKKGSHYLIDAAQFQNHWYYVAGSDTAAKINLYKDPLSTLKDPTVAKALPAVAFYFSGGTNASFSANARFVGLQAGQNLAVYDIETQQRYQYTLQTPLSAPLSWMDGHRWIGDAGGSLLIMDYDGTNHHALVPTADPNGGYFSKNFNQMFTLAPAPDGASATVLEAVDMRAGQDLPAR